MRPLDAFSAVFSLAAVSRRPFLAALFWMLVAVVGLRADPSCALGALGGMVVAIAFYRVRDGARSTSQPPPPRVVLYGAARSVISSAVTCVLAPAWVAAQGWGRVSGELACVALSAAWGYTTLSPTKGAGERLAVQTALYVGLLGVIRAAEALWGAPHVGVDIDPASAALYQEGMVIMFGAALSIAAYETYTRWWLRRRRVAVVGAEGAGVKGQ